MDGPKVKKSYGLVGNPHGEQIDNAMNDWHLTNKQHMHHNG